MRYISTRGRAPALDFAEVLLAGMANDGGLYVPEQWPVFSAAEWRALRGKSYQDIALAVMTPFVGDCLTREELQGVIARAYHGFRHQEVAPLVQMDGNLWLLELFHGPTLAFKDVALQLLGQLFDIILAKRNQRVTIVGATSGDTGSAAMEAVRDRAAIDIFILFPEGRVSEVQRRQMTTIPSANVHALAVKGSFDDCQDLVKAMFADQDFRQKIGLSAVNSINWARIMAQIVYYAAAALRLGGPDRPVSFVVPTGNFGNIYAAYAARQMGLPIEKLVVGTNRNDVLTRYFTNSDMRLAPVEPSLSPSMDIQISSNFERLLFDLYGRDGARVDRDLSAFRQDGEFSTGIEVLARARELFSAFRADDVLTRETMAHWYQRTGMVIDPHTAVGLAAAKQFLQAEPEFAEQPVISLACAHPAKFPDAVQLAIGQHPALPPHLADSLFHQPERQTVLDGHLQTVQNHIMQRARILSVKETHV